MGNRGKLMKLFIYKGFSKEFLEKLEERPQDL